MSRAPSGSVALRHGLTDQEAPQAHAQEEAQEAAEKDPLAASSAGQVSSGRPTGAAVSRVRVIFHGWITTPVEAVPPSHTDPGTDAAMRSRARSASETCSKTAAYD